MIQSRRWRGLLAYCAHKGADFVVHPYAMMLRAKGVVSDTYIKLDQPWIRDIGIRTVLDVGGNVGRFSKTMQYLLPDARLIAFEPIPDCFEQMQKLMADCERFSAYNLGLGEVPGTVNLTVSPHNPSSSFLRMGALHKEAFPFTAGGKELTVKVERLDDLIARLDVEFPLMIKVDVQGFEDKVLRGGMETFSKAKILFLELSYQELYDGQPLFDDMYRLLSELGFKFQGTTTQALHPRTGMYLDADCLFVKD
jgi:FkbM family methyltransferase